MCIGLHVYYPYFLSDFNQNRIFFMDFTKNTQISSFMKIRPVGAELCHADRRRDGQTDKQTDMTMLIAAFYNFAKAPEN